ncbi:MAG: hypothetical protein JO033_28200 [Acidobacteriaceae bacterium]|nr:hypothetical protein [Acidobacteriaceae bacterium]
MRHLGSYKKVSLLLVSLLFIVIPVSAQSSAGEEETQKLQNATQNPVISVPVQNNSNFGIGSADRTQNVLNIQRERKTTAFGFVV